MKTNTATTAIIEADPDGLFEVLTDVDHLAEWNRIISRVLRRPNEMTSGAEWVVEMHAMGQTWPSRCPTLLLPLGNRRRQPLLHRLALADRASPDGSARRRQLGAQPEDLLAPPSHRPPPPPRPRPRSAVLHQGTWPRRSTDDHPAAALRSTGCAPRRWRGGGPDQVNESIRAPASGEILLAADNPASQPKWCFVSPPKMNW